MSLQNIGRYEITGELGRGAMGVVYKATDPTIGRTVALKTLRLDVQGIDSEELVRRFKNEARAAGALSHPNLVTIFDAGEQGGTFYIAMECIEGTTLQRLLIDRGSLSLEQIIDIAGQVCAGLDYAHQRGIVHRDIKPSNIMVTPTGTVKITDFGVAKSSSGMTSTGQVLGTPDYMSPEQIKGQHLDGRSDLFSVGVLLYEMVTGEKPFIAQTVTTVIYKIVHETPIPPRELDASVHPGLSTVITKALAKSPDERYQTGAELTRDLKNYRSISDSTGAQSALPGAEDGFPTTKLPLLTQPPAAAAATAMLASVSPASSGAAAAPARIDPASKPASETSCPAGVAIPPPPAKPSHSMSAVIWAMVVLLLIAGAAAAVMGYRHRQQRRAQAAAAQPQITPAPQPSMATAPTAAPAPSTPSSTPASEVISQQPLAPKPATGDLSLSSAPDGARVQIDGNSAPGWITPFVATGLSAGKHTLTFSKNGYTSETRKVDAVAGNAVGISVQLTATTASFAVDSTPPGARIIIDGQDSGKATPAQVTVKPGEHKIALLKPGYQRAHTLAEVGPGQNLRYAPTLKPGNGEAGRDGHAPAENELPGLKRLLANAKAENKGLLVILTRPQGAQITVGDKSLPRSTPFRFPVPVGRYMLTIKLNGYRPIQRSIAIELGKLALIDETLQPQ